MSVDVREDDSRTDVPAAADAGPLGLLPRLTRRQVQAEGRLIRLLPRAGDPAFEAVLGELIGPIAPDGPAEVLWRASGLRRPGLVAQLAWPRLSTRLALGIETPVAHALVDRWLGFERFDAEGRLQLSPVEWGILTFLLARTLARLGERPGPLGAWDLSLDRAGPDPFDARGLGSLVTLRWPVRVGKVAGSVRLWLPETLVARWLSTAPPPLPAPDPARAGKLADLAGVWRAEAGTVAMPRGLGRLRAGGVLPIDGSPLRGTPRDPHGPVILLAQTDRDGRFAILTDPVADSGGGRLTVTSPMRRTSSPRETAAVNASSSDSQTDAPVTLIVELGRVSLSLHRLADLKPGDVVELGRHSREPVELTSAGRLVARGELVQIDTELGVRVTNVFL